MPLSRHCKQGGAGTSEGLPTSAGTDTTHLALERLRQENPEVKASLDTPEDAVFVVVVLFWCGFARQGFCV